MIGDVQRLAAALADGDVASQTMAAALHTALTVPGPVEDRLFLVGEHQPVIIEWGMGTQAAIAAASALESFMGDVREAHATANTQNVPDVLAQVLQRQPDEGSASDEPAFDESVFDERRNREQACRGAITVSLIWNSTDDLDIHIRCPTGETINFGNREACGGTLDVDMNANATNLSSEPIENVFWPEDMATPGVYTIMVHHYRQREGEPGAALSFKVRLSGTNADQTLDGDIIVGELKAVAEFVVPVQGR